MNDDERRVKGQVERAAASGAFVGGGTLFTEPVLVVNRGWPGRPSRPRTTSWCRIHKQLEDPLRSLVVASALCVDTALKQDKRGFN